MKHSVAADPRSGNFSLGWISRPAMAGVLDSSSYIYLLVGTTEVTFYALTLFLKLAILSTAVENIGHARRFLPFAIVTLFAIALSSFANESTPLEALKPVAVIVSAIITLTIIRHDIVGYAKGMALSGFVVCAGFLTSVAAGAIATTGDRHDFFAGSHPNLGGELISSTLVMAAFALRPRSFAALVVAALYCTFLLQSRTATVVIVISIACYSTFHSSIKFGWRATTWGIFTLAFLLTGLAAVFAAIQSEAALTISSFVFDAVFLVEDQYRGGGSGLSGRDQHWLAAMQVISDHPFLGAGPDFAARQGGLQPHNWVLYALSQYGVLGWALIALFMAATFTAVKHDPVRLMAFIPLLVPWLINDRFLNFNAYPFVIYILAFASFSAAGQKSGETATLLRTAYRRSARSRKRRRHTPRRFREHSTT